MLSWEVPQSTAPLLWAVECCLPISGAGAAAGLCEAQRARLCRAQGAIGAEYILDTPLRLLERAPKVDWVVRVALPVVNVHEQHAIVGAAHVAPSGRVALQDELARSTARKASDSRMITCV